MRKTKRNRSSLIVVLVLVIAFALTACSSATVEETKVSETTVEPKEEVTEVEVAEVEPTPESTAEPTAEPTPEPILYEGIDMESELPGAEWMQTFVGIIEQPKIVIFNDKTGRKEIIENDDIVKFNPDEDLMGLYLPEGTKAIRKTKGICFEETAGNEGCGEIYKLDATETRNRGRQLAALYVEVDGEEVALTFDLRPE